MHRVFLLSPAHCGGERARILKRDAAAFALAQRLRSPQGAPLGEVFQFISGFYFRGKLRYARAFPRPPSGVPGVLVITPNRGLAHPDERVTLDTLRAFARSDVDEVTADFVGRGDMSRGGLLLRCMRAATELRYIPVAGAVRHGTRPAKLAPLSRASPRRARRQVPAAAADGGADAGGNDAERGVAVDGA